MVNGFRFRVVLKSRAVPGQITEFVSTSHLHRRTEKREMELRELSDVCCEQNADAVKQRAAIEKLLKAGADIQETDKNGVTPLHHAVRFRSPAAVETLLRHGAVVNQTCKRSGSTAP